MKLFKFLMSLFFLIGLMSCQPEWVKKGAVYDYEGMQAESIDLHKNIQEFLYDIQTTSQPLYIYPQAKIKSVKIDRAAQYFEVEFTKPFSFIPFREETVALLYSRVSDFLDSSFKPYHFNLKCLGAPIEELIPNYYRSNPGLIDSTRIPLIKSALAIPVVQRLGRPFYMQGLSGMNIAVWASHGWYYNHQAGRWEWQRPRLFQTVEDMLSVGFVVPYLMPMLENAGAAVYTPRERDIQINEVVVDNDSRDSQQIFETWSDGQTGGWQSNVSGFKVKAAPLKDGQNLFNAGTYNSLLTDTLATAGVRWCPKFPESGEYAVYISYKTLINSTRNARYTINHLGGQTTFLVNQQKGGGTWNYLGTFKFLKGLNEISGKVELDNESSNPGQIITADAVRFGGGMGSVERGGLISNRPRFLEAARYWLQYAGYPDSLVYKMAGDSNDYVDDYKSRPEFANYLCGSPLRPTENGDPSGFGIPIDMSLAFHTDAGISPDESNIGTMAIYSIFNADSQLVYSNGASRLANRDLADIMQTQVVADIRSKYQMNWPRRILKEAWYSEAARPDHPSVLLELLSHQNFSDAQLAADPRFRFDVCRAVYKAMLKFLSVQKRRSYIVQPLPVKGMVSIIDSGRIIINWQQQPDPLEITANAKSFIVYIRQDSSGFDSGRRVMTNQFILQNPQKGIIYSFIVRAENEGGLSMPSEVVSTCIREGSEGTVLVVGGFDRISGPQVQASGKNKGFFHLIDQGVPDKIDVNYTGMQYEFDKTVGFKSNDAPGHGASFADFEDRVIPGNSFDFAYIHGEAITNADWSFTSCSDEAVETGHINLDNYKIIDWILGEEKEIPGPDSIYFNNGVGNFKAVPVRQQKIISNYLNNGGKMYISGAHVGTDLNAGKLPVHEDVRFSRKILKMDWITNHAARQGRVWSSDSSFLPIRESINFNTIYHPQIYTVEAPDAINPFAGAVTLLRYSDNNFSAAIGYQGRYNLVVCGFPFETIISAAHRHRFMKAVIQYLTHE